MFRQILTGRHTIYHLLASAHYMSMAISIENHYFFCISPAIIMTPLFSVCSALAMVIFKHLTGLISRGYRTSQKCLHTTTRLTITFPFSGISGVCVTSIAFTFIGANCICAGCILITVVGFISTFVII